MSDFFSVVNLDQADDRFSIASLIIEQEIAEYPEDVKEGVRRYADGNLGAARLIARLVKTQLCQTIEDVATAVGWSLKDGRKEQGYEIYERLIGRRNKVGD